MCSPLRSMADRRSRSKQAARGRPDKFAKKSWLLNDLSILRSGGARLRTAKSKLSVRPASPDEATVFGLVANRMNASEEMVLAYLVDLDSQEDRPWK